MDGNLWDDSGNIKGWDALKDLQVGSTCNVVAVISCSLNIGGSALVVLHPNNVSARISGLKGLNDSTTAITLIGATYGGCEQLHNFVVGDNTLVIEHGPVRHSDLFQTVELCAGIGVMTYGLERAGFHTHLACELRQPFVETFRELHPGAIVIQGDICEAACIREIVQHSPPSCTIVAGFNCQPYSRAGSMMGQADPRSASLRGVLNIGFLLRSPLFILECVVEASKNRHVIAELKTFCLQCGFRFSDITLKLQEIWPARRDRWWVVLSAQSLGKIPLQAFPWILPHKVVRNILPKPLSISKEDLDQLILKGDELMRFLEFQPDLSSMYLPLGGLCPTLLHSLGSQTVGCMCGCRDVGFNAGTLQKGLFGVLMPTDSTIQIGDNSICAVRHPHPDEAAILSAMPIPFTWPCPLRVALAGIGQQANPLQALWVAAQIVAQIDVVIQGTTNFSPRALLEQFVHDMMVQAHVRVLRTEIPKCLEFESEGECPVPVDVDKPPLSFVIPTVLSPSSVLIVDAQKNVCTEFKLQNPECTVGHLITAEAQLARQPVLVEVTNFRTGEPMHDHEMLEGKHISIRTFPLTDLQADLNMDSSNDFPAHGGDITPTIPYEVDQDSDSPMSPGQQELLHEHPAVSEGNMSVSDDECNPPDLDFSHRKDPLLVLRSDQLVNMQQPVVSSTYALQSYRAQTMHAKVRLTLLWQQEQCWADDEITWHLQQCVEQTTKEGVIVLDPLLATAVVHDGKARLLCDWFRTLGQSPKTIVTAICVSGHWSPFVWTWNAACLSANSWDLPNFLPHAKVLHETLANLVGAQTFVVRTHHRTDNASMACGVCAVRYIDHVLNGKMLPTETHEVLYLNGVGKDLFKQFVKQQEHVCRPWLWGNGLDNQVHQRLCDLLKQHGVPPALVESRIQVIVLAIGVPALQKAITGTAPWRSLKALANQSQPKLQLIMPDELKAVVDAKATAGVGTRKKKPQGDKQPPTKPVPLDPSKLEFDNGAFTNELGQPVAQLQAKQLGPLVEGVTLALFSEVEPFLRAGQVITKGALAVLLLNADESCLNTKLRWAECRVALRCAANGEPMLVNGYLVQLGQTTVIQAKAKHVIDLPDVPTACVKVSIYRDGTEVDWEHVISGPVKYILQHLEVLQSCRVDGCSCPKWHGDGSPIQDPVFDVWRRQWLNLSMKPSAPNKADLFVVNVRYAGSLEAKVLGTSGNNGIFLEPRSQDAKEAILDYQVIWLAKHSMTDLVHMRQCNPGIVGIARLGARLGIRLRTEDVATIGKAIKPDAVLLTGGPKCAFEIGPVPFGVDRLGLSKICAEWGWVAKPVHPARSVPSLGTVWIVHACTDPPSSIFSIKGKNDVVITKLAPKAPPAAMPKGAVGSSATIDLCALQTKPDCPSDPWLLKDPWGASASKLATSRPIKFDVDAGLQQVEERIEKSIMAKLPASRPDMEVDSGSADISSATSDRLQALEAQVQQIASSHQKLEVRVDEAAKKSDAQISQLQHHMSAQLEGQGSRIEDLFRGQMAQLEALLSKKQRFE